MRPSPKPASKIGVLLINLGTPASPSTNDVARFLNNFLMDKAVIPLPLILRFLLVYGLITPSRKRAVARKYQAIWLRAGSPLRVYSERLSTKLQNTLGEQFIVSLGMRYQSPTYQDASKTLLDCSKVICLPLFPQFAKATTGSCIQAVQQYFLDQGYPEENLRFIHDFYQHPAFINALSKSAASYLTEETDHLLISYHGLPENQTHTHNKKHPICNAACPLTTQNLTHCYRAQCFQTSTLLCQSLNWPTAQASTCFQSRLGRLPWIKPDILDCLADLAKQGKRHVAVICPSFMTDCLETLEEIQLSAQNYWQQLGGESFTFIPCLNDQSHAVEAVEAIIESIG